MTRRFLPAAALALLLLAGAPATAAFADDVPETGLPGHLVLSADPYPASFTLSPGEPAYWPVTARLEDADEATLRIELFTDGELAVHPRGLTMTVTRCDERWAIDAEPQCTSGGETIATIAPDASGDIVDPDFRFAPLTPEAPEHLLITLAIEDSPAARADDSLMGLAGDFGIGLTATAIDGIPVPPEDPLAVTGVSAAFLAGGAVLGGLLIAGGAHLALRRRREVRA